MKKKALTPRRAPSAAAPSRRNAPGGGLCSRRDRGRRREAQQGAGVRGPGPGGGARPRGGGWPSTATNKHVFGKTARSPRFLPGSGAPWGSWVPTGFRAFGVCFLKRGRRDQRSLLRVVFGHFHFPPRVPQRLPGEHAALGRGDTRGHSSQGRHPPVRVGGSGASPLAGSVLTTAACPRPRGPDGDTGTPRSVGGASSSSVPGPALAPRGPASRGSTRSPLSTESREGPRKQ